MNPYQILIAILLISFPFGIYGIHIYHKGKEEMEKNYAEINKLI